MMSTPSELTFGQSNDAGSPGVPQQSPPGSQSAGATTVARSKLPLILAIVAMVLLVLILVVVVMARK
jgi:hypothetical protein